MTGRVGEVCPVLLVLIDVSYLLIAQDYCIHVGAGRHLWVNDLS